MRRYSLIVRRWIFGVLATFGVTAAIAVPLLIRGNPTHGSRYYWTIPNTTITLPSQTLPQGRDGQLFLVNGKRLTATGFEAHHTH